MHGTLTTDKMNNFLKIKHIIVYYLKINNKKNR